MLVPMVNVLVVLACAVVAALASFAQNGPRELTQAGAENDGSHPALAVAEELRGDGGYEECSICLCGEAEAKKYQKRAKEPQSQEAERSKLVRARRAGRNRRSVASEEVPALPFAPFLPGNRFTAPVAKNKLRKRWAFITKVIGGASGLPAVYGEKRGRCGDRCSAKQVRMFLEVGRVKYCRSSGKPFE